MECTPWRSSVMQHCHPSRGQVVTCLPWGCGGSSNAHHCMSRQLTLPQAEAGASSPTGVWEVMALCLGKSLVTCGRVFRYSLALEESWLLICSLPSRREGSLYRLCITNRLQGSSTLLDTDTCPKTLKVTFFKELRGLRHKQDDAPPSESQ